MSDRLAIDLLAGSARYRELVESGGELDEWVREWPDQLGGPGIDAKLDSAALPMLDELLGRQTRIALYYMISIVEGRTERALIYNGPVMPNDIMIGDPPEGMIATGVPHPDSAEARFVPDPERLDWRRRR